VEDRWTSYVNAEKFGNQGSIFIGRNDLDRHVEVGSRFGNTNVAANSLIMTAFQVSGGYRWAQLGFHDSGATLVLPSAGGATVRGLDLHDTANNNIVRTVRQSTTIDPLLVIDTRVVQGTANGSGGFNPAFAAGSSTIVLTDSGAADPATSAIRVGDVVTGTGVAAHTYVTNIDAATHTITLSKPTIGAGPTNTNPADGSYFYTFSKPGVAAIVGQNPVDRLAYNSSGVLSVNTNFSSAVGTPLPE